MNRVSSRNSGEPKAVENSVGKHEDMLSAENYLISEATARNWKKLNTSSENRLTKRANKRNSKKRIVPLEYISNRDNLQFVYDILDFTDDNGESISSVILSLGINLLKKAGLYEKPHIASFLKEYSDIKIIEQLAEADIPQDEADILGFIYQAYMQEGKKNAIGSYYTPHKVAYNMTKGCDFSNGQSLLDPCCGSGAMLLAANADDPGCLYGVDNDETAVIAAKINLLLKYPDSEFSPQIYCMDYLEPDSDEGGFVLGKKFDYIITNPPWGAVGKCENGSSESFSHFLIRAYEQLKSTGIIRFLFPQAILNVKAHKGIRSFMLETAGIKSITIYDEMFSGVTTKYVDIECGHGADNEYFLLKSGNEQRRISVETVYETENLVFNFLSNEDIAIIQKIKSNGRYSLKNSIWALGIVTGNNKEKLSPKCLPGMEKIYTGKEIEPYVLKPARNYILFNRESLQQVAKDEIYRAEEKLVYKFISNKLVFAYDNSASLFLNSANILIPDIPSMSTKCVMAFLNSLLFKYLYIKMFGEVKILKGNLIELPFPEISENDNRSITDLVDEILGGNSAKKAAVDDYIFRLYNLSTDQIRHIRKAVDERVD